MEHAPGADASTIWSELDLDEKLQVKDDILEIQRKLVSINFAWQVPGNKQQR